MASAALAVARVTGPKAPSAPAERLISGLLRPDDEITPFLIDEMGRKLTEYHFTDPTLRSLFRAACSFRSVAGGVLTPQAVADLVSGSDAGTSALVSETYDALALASAVVSAADVRWAAERLRIEREGSLTATALRDAQEILSGKVTEEDRGGKPGRTWSGAADAREWAAERIAEIAAEADVSTAPAADVRFEGREIIETFNAAALERIESRPRFGLPTLDDTMAGLAPGELIIVAAPSGKGKSQLCVQCAYEAVFSQGLHVFFATSETVRATVRARMVARHSRADRFADLRAEVNAPHGLNSSDLSRGRLPAGQDRLFAACVASLSEAEGSLWLAQIPYGQTVGSLAAQVASRSRSRGVDLVVIDYLALMAAGRRFGDQRTELREIVLDAKHLATDYDKGKGVPVMSPWQFNRRAQEELVRTGEPDINGLSETAEAVNSADGVISLFEDGDRDQKRFASLRCHLLKNRDGAQLVGNNALNLRVDYATSHFAERLTAGGGAESRGSSGFGAAPGSDGTDTALYDLLDSPVGL